VTARNIYLRADNIAPRVRRAEGVMRRRAAVRSPRIRKLTTESQRARSETPPSYSFPSYACCTWERPCPRQARRRAMPAHSPSLSRWERAGVREEYACDCHIPVVLDANGAPLLLLRFRLCLVQVCHAPLDEPVRVLAEGGLDLRVAHVRNLVQDFRREHPCPEGVALHKFSE